MKNALLDKWRVKKLKKILKKINKLSNTMAQLSDKDLQMQTYYFKERLLKGETLDDILVEAFASVREAAKRVTGMYPYDVQVLGAIVLHQEHIAEMKTGEGKTLTATMPLYLNALSGKGAILVTTNNYLANRDAQEMGKIYEFMGLTVGNIAKYDDKKLTPQLKKQLYNCDIVYTTHSGLGFDYLMDNLASSTTHKFLRPFHYVIIDEIDAILLDNAQTPLVISGSPKVQSNLYHICNNFVLTLEKNSDYKLDNEKKNIWLTERGVDAAERFFLEKPLYTTHNFQLIQHILLALRAHHLFEKDKDYVVDNKEIKLLDRQDGRILDGVKLQLGQHQALETKENVAITSDDRAMATITYQNLFKLFKKMSGMTGTAKIAEDEFIDTYQLEVIVVPTHKPIIRKDYPNKIYPTLPEKLYASMALVKSLHEKGQPIIIATANVDVSFIYSQLLLMEGIPHNVLNAYNVAKEAEIIKAAGQKGAVTVATPIAGRGTDIVLGKGVQKLGGLAIIGTEMMTNPRIDLQMRGRSGRQGDPGMSQFFISLEDDVIVKNGTKWLIKQYKKLSVVQNAKQPRQLTSKRIERAIRQAQDVSETTGRRAREMALAFDESIKLQRELLYKERDLLIEQQEFVVKKIVEETIQHFLNQNMPLTVRTLERYILDNISYQFDHYRLKQIDSNDTKQIKQFLMAIIQEELTKKEMILKSKQNIANFYRTCMIKAMDESWILQVDYLQQLRIMITTRIHAQKDPLKEYKKEAFLAFNNMKCAISKNILKRIMLSTVTIENDRVSIHFI